MGAPQIVEYLDRLAAIAWQRDDVVGVVAFGSTADRHRADESMDAGRAIALDVTRRHAGASVGAD